MLTNSNPIHLTLNKNNNPSSPLLTTSMTSTLLTNGSNFSAADHSLHASLPFSTLSSPFQTPSSLLTPSTSTHPQPPCSCDLSSSSSSLPSSSSLIEPAYYYNHSIPVFTPTYAQFQNFDQFVQQIDHFGQQYGILKVIPPKQWIENLPDIRPALSRAKISKPISQSFEGTSCDVMQLCNMEIRRSYSVTEFAKLSLQKQHRPPYVVVSSTSTSNETTNSTSNLTTLPTSSLRKIQEETTLLTPLSSTKATTTTISSSCASATTSTNDQSTILTNSSSSKDKELPETVLTTHTSQSLLTNLCNVPLDTKNEKKLNTPNVHQQDSITPFLSTHAATHVELLSKLYSKIPSTPPPRCTTYMEIQESVSTHPPSLFTPTSPTTGRDHTSPHSSFSPSSTSHLLPPTLPIQQTGQPEEKTSISNKAYKPKQKNTPLISSHSNTSTTSTAFTLSRPVTRWASKKLQIYSSIHASDPTHPPTSIDLSSTSLPPPAYVPWTPSSTASTTSIKKPSTCFFTTLETQKNERGASSSFKSSLNNMKGKRLNTTSKPPPTTTKKKGDSVDLNQLTQHGPYFDDLLSCKFTPAYYMYLEEVYWRHLSTCKPIYGADLLGTLFTHDQPTTWNPNRLDGLLSKLKTKIPGVNVPYLYFGLWRSTFAWHVEDVDLYSINYLHLGAPKQWYSISPHQAKKFEKFCQSIYVDDYKVCNEFIRHKTYVFSPSFLKAHGFQVFHVVQEPQEFILTFPYGYHAGFNLGFNCAESVNFATPRWLTVGVSARKCECIQDAVMVDVHRIERIYQGREDGHDENLGHPPPTQEQTKLENVEVVEVEKEKKNFDDQCKLNTRIRIKRKMDDLLGGAQTQEGTRPSKQKKRKKKTDLFASYNDLNNRDYTFGSTESSDTFPCMYCPSLSTLDLLPVQNTLGSAHQSCAEWIPELWLHSDDTGNTYVLGSEFVPNDRFLLLKCYICKIKKGACVQCSVPSCTRAVHVSCAINHEWIKQTELICPKHQKKSKPLLSSTPSSPPLTLPLSVETSDYPTIPSTNFIQIEDPSFLSSPSLSSTLSTCITQTIHDE
ncbi:hypothetical protein HMI54_003220 [Coelomomyces lativittatus]|nr:hypothetical protein HMI56_000722 [Coelomomyces lativittatus]KAJ1508455.1 hypothetical protein HMI54_003220 [Coelomomyces lativittatus]KAJ1517708.1 hypothetical protein HMI55_006254 [Coelomomyces lativittatus]